MNDIERALPIWLQGAEISLPHRDVSPNTRPAVQGESRDGPGSGRIPPGGPGHRVANPKVILQTLAVGLAASAFTFTAIINPFS